MGELIFIEQIKKTKLSLINLCTFKGQKVISKNKTLFPFTNNLNAELAIHTKLAKEKLCPEIIDFDKKKNLIIYEYLEGTNDISNLDEKFLSKLGRTLKRFHQASIQDAKISTFKEKIGMYKEILINSSDAAVKAGFELFDRLYEDSEDFVFCHNDINASNIFYNNDIKLIDWEYAGFNLPIYDIASVSSVFNLDDYQLSILMDFYNSNLDISSIKNFELLNSMVEYIWLQALKISDS